MLVKVTFNNKVFRCREEDEDELLLYNLRCGDMFFLSGEAKELLLKLQRANLIEVDSNNNIVKLLILLNAILIAN